MRHNATWTGLSAAVLLIACGEIGTEPRPSTAEPAAAAAQQTMDRERIAALEAQLALAEQRLKAAEARAIAAEARALAKPKQFEVPAVEAPEAKADPTVELRSEDEIKAAAIGLGGDDAPEGAQRD